MSTYTITIQAPTIKPVKRRKTGKIFIRNPFLNSNDRDHWRVTSPIKNAWKANTANAAEQANLPKGLARVRIDGLVFKPHAREYDAMNFYPTAKACVDALTGYGLFEDDSNEFVEGPFLKEGGVGPAALQLTITEIADQNGG